MAIKYHPDKNPDDKTAEDKFKEASEAYHVLSNSERKQNYDNLYINMNNGFGGNLSNLKYYNYAIGTFEIDNIVNIQNYCKTNIMNKSFLMDSL